MTEPHAAKCQRCGVASAGVTHICPPPEFSGGSPSLDPAISIPLDAGISPCFVHCGAPACRKLGCVKVYNARHRDA